jgi:hypothetical protein
MDDQIIPANPEVDTYVEKKSKTKWLVVAVGMLILAILLLALIVSMKLVGQETSYRSKAYTVSSTENLQEDFIRSESLENSYAFASPIQAKSGGELIRVTVFILDGQGKGIKDKKVVLTTNPALKINEIQSSTDEMGKAIFDVSATSSGLFTLEPSVGGAKINQKLNLLYK